MIAPPSDPMAALSAVERIASVAVLLASLELFARPETVQRGGLLAWEIVRLRSTRLTHGVLARVLEHLLAPPGLWALLVARMLAAAWILFGLDAGRPLAVVVVASITLLVMLRTSYGNDGADQMILIVFVAAAVARLRPTAAVISAALWFLTLQVCLSYATSGIAKLMGRRWRDGTGIVGILGTSTYGVPALAALLERFPAMALVVSWSVIFTEIAFPAVLLTPTSLVPWFLVGGLLFHVATAVVMGLGSFVWAFAATYPAVYVIATR